MKILLVNKFYHPKIGGVETVVRQYAEALAKAGHEATVLCASDVFAASTKNERLDGVEILRCSSLGTFLSMPCSISLPFRFASMMRRFDAIHFHEPFPLGSLCGALLPRPEGRRFKVFATWHSDIVRQKLFKPFAQFLQNILLSRCDRIFATSAGLADSSPLLRRRRASVDVIPLSIDPARYPSGRPRHPEAPSRYILSLGRLSAYKGIPSLLDAFAKAKTPPALKLLIAGDGAIAESVSERIGREDLRERAVFIKRQVDDAEKLSLLEHCEFFAFPSILPTEAFGITQLEAMAYSKAVVNTSLPTGVPWVGLDGESALTVPPGDCDALAKAIERLASDDALREKLGAGGRRRLEDLFTDEAALKLYLSYFSGLDDRKKGRA
jgi:rhamnosyl/mannosyltransferase